MQGKRRSHDFGEGDLADYLAMLLIRRMEERILALFSEGRVSGTTHTCIGQEADAVGIIGQLDPERDYVLSNHRNHGHYVAFGGPVGPLIAEIMGRPEGVCGGRGGSQHIKHGHFLSNGVQGGIAPIAVGMALGEKTAGSGGIVVACLGDGTLGQGVVYEALNMASLWELPVLFLVEDNGYAQTTPLAQGVKGSIVDRARPFDVQAAEIDSSDVTAIRAWGREQIGYVRETQRPLWGVIHTKRLAAHSKGDDTRDPDELRRLTERDPLLVHGARLTEEQRQEAEQTVAELIRSELLRLGLRDGP
jgi:TPP-dependent pyruvate/acetoin dehydrogenase alpha subunit